MRGYRLFGIVAVSIGFLWSGCGGMVSSGVGSDGGSDGGGDRRGDGGGVVDLAMSSVPDMAGPQPTIIRVHYPAMGHSLTLRGEAGPLNWMTGQAMTASGMDTFVYSTTQIDKPTELKPLLDDKTWSRGSNYRVSPGATIDVYPHFNNGSGKVTKLIAPFHSASLNNDRTVWAYLPASYDENPYAHYPVLYMHDGQNLFDPKLAFGGNEWMVDETLDAGDEALDHGMSIRELIVIGPENTAKRIYEYTPTKDQTVNDGGGGDLYLKMLVEELKPKVDSMLRTLPDRDHTGIMGSSLGGLISAYGGVKRPNTYGIVGAMSPSTWWDNQVIITDVMAVKGMMPRANRVYVDSGDAGQSNDDVTQTNQLAQTYLTVGYMDNVDFEHVVQMGGQHNEVYWAQRLPGALRFLFGGQSPY